MNNTQIDEDARQLSIIARALSYLCLESTALKGKNRGQQATFLKSLGFKNAEIAELLGIAVDAVSVRLAEAKRERPSKKLSVRKGTSKTDPN